MAIVTREIDRKDLKNQTYVENHVGNEKIKLNPNAEAFAQVVLQIVENYMELGGESQCKSNEEVTQRA